MPVIQIAQSLGVFILMCLAAATVLWLIVAGMARLEMATTPTDRRAPTRH